MSTPRLLKSSGLLLAALALAPFAQAQLTVTGGSTKGYFPAGSVTVGPNVSSTSTRTPNVVGAYSNASIEWGVATSSTLVPVAWRTANLVTFQETSFEAVAPNTQFKIADISYRNGTTDADTNITGFTLSVTFDIVTDSFNTSFAIPVSFQTISVSDTNAPPLTVAGIAYSNLNTPDGFVDSVPFRTGPNVWNNPDYLFIQLPETPLSFDFYDPVLDIGATYTFTGFGFGAAASEVFFVPEGETVTTEFFAQYSVDEYSPIPEPSAFGMLGAGVLVGFAALRRRQVRKSA